MCIIYVSNLLVWYRNDFFSEMRRDFIDVYLAEVKKTTDPNSVFYGARAGNKAFSLQFIKYSNFFISLVICMYCLADITRSTRFISLNSERQLVATLADLFFAGSDTTSTTLSWGVLYLCKFPHVQKKFQEEIASISNNSRNISVADRPE